MRAEETTVNTETVTLPNFLIVGAAKSGTTSLYHYLKQHPDVFMSSIKEPKFITSQFLSFPSNGIGDAEIQKDTVRFYKDYCQLFKSYEGKKAVGEASADNLYYYEKSIQYIKKFIANPKILIILRDPVERCYSAYMSLIRENREFLSFENALKQEEYRKRNNWEYIWFYKDAGFYYNQVKAFIQNFNQVTVYLYDDLRRDTLGLIKNMYDFLEVDSSFIPDIEIKYNVSGIPKSMFLHKFLKEPNLLKSTIKPFLEMIFSDKNIARMVENFKIKNLAKPEMNPETREYLKKLYREDILKLQDLINRDLSHWLR